MSLLAYLVDETNIPADVTAPGTAKLWDFADTTGAFNPGGVWSKVFGFDAGSYEPELGLFSPDTGDGSYRTRRRAPSVSATLTLRTGAASNASHRQGWGRLLSLLAEPRVLVWREDGGTAARLVYLLGASVPQLLRGGQANWDFVLRQYADNEGAPLTLYRQPVILDATALDPAVNALANPFLIHSQSGTNGATADRPTGWTWRTTAGSASTTGISGESTGGTADGLSVVVADGTTKDLTQDTGAATASPADVWSGQVTFYAAAASGLTVGVVIQYADSGGTLLGSETVGTAVTADGLEHTVTVTSAAAPASTDRVRLKLRITNASGASATVVLRRAQLEEAAATTTFRAPAATVPNDPASERGRTFLLWNPGDAPTPAGLTLTMDSGAAIAGVQLARRSNLGVTGLRRLGDYVNETKYAQAEPGTERGWTATLYNETTQPSAGDDADASGNGTPTAASDNYVRCSHTTTPAVSKRRERWTRTTKLDSLRGRFDVWVRLRPASQRKYYVRGKWGPSTTDPAPNVWPEVLVDTLTGNPGAHGFVEVKLGTMTIPTDPNVALGGVTVELWSRIGDGGAAANLDWDLVWLTPADAAELDDAVSTLFIPGGATETVLGKNLTSAPAAITGDPAWAAGAANNNALRLNADNEACGWGPNTGTTLGTGRHRFTFKLADTLTGTRTVWVSVANVTDNSEASSGAGTALRRTFSSTRVPAEVTIEFDGTAAKAYQPRVAIETYGTAGRLDVQEITYEYVPAVASGEKLRADATRYTIEKLDSSGNILVYAGGTGEVPLTLAPGLNLVAVRCDEVPLQGYFERQNKITRTPTITPASFRAGRFHL